MLSQEVMAEEIKDVMFMLGRNKTPKPDDFSVEFYARSWETVGELVTEAIQDFFRCGKLLKEINNTIIALVPKIINPTSLRNY